MNALNQLKGKIMYPKLLQEPPRQLLTVCIVQNTVLSPENVYNGPESDHLENCVITIDYSAFGLKSKLDEKAS